MVILKFICHATAQISGYIMSNKFRNVNFPKGTFLRVSLVCRIIISKISLLQYLTPQQKIRHCCPTLTYQQLI
jgi:hypothetical protein